MNTMPDSGTVQGLVVSAAIEELLPRFNRIGHDVKDDGSVVTEADLAVDLRLKTELSERWPDIPMLSEEMSVEEQDNLLTDPNRLFWCLDPLDGTSNFASGLPVFAVSLALIFRGEPILGVVYDPIQDESFRSEKGKGVWLNERILIPNEIHLSLEKTLALIDFKRLPPKLSKRLTQHRPYRSQRNFGCCALEWVWMAAGRGHIYLHGGQKLWDYAAGCLILDEVGGYSCDLKGEAVFQASLTPRSVIASSNASLFKEWCTWLEI